MKKRVNISIDEAILKAATKYAKERYELGTFSRMVAMALIAMMKKDARR